jgi:hypothetical protein
MKPKSISLFDVDTMLMKVVENKETALVLVLALRQIGLYEAIAKRQNKRIWDAQRRAQEAFDQSIQAQHRAKTTLRKVGLYKSRKSNMERWFAISNAEAHFYLICWDAVGKLIEALKANGNGFNSLRKMWRLHQAKFKEYKDARDHLEHWVERLPGKARNTWKMSHSDGVKQFSGNMGRVRIEGVFTFREQGRDKEVDICPASADLLEKICSQLRNDLTAEVRTLFESGAKVADKKSKSAESLVPQAFISILDGLVPVKSVNPKPATKKEETKR